MIRLSLFCLTVATVLYTAERIVAKAVRIRPPDVGDNGFVIVFIVLAVAFGLAAFHPRWRKSAEDEADRMAREIAPLVRRAMSKESSGEDDA